MGLLFVFLYHSMNILCQMLKDSVTESIDKDATILCHLDIGMRLLKQFDSVKYSIIRAVDTSTNRMHGP